ncbi:hypothetical protein Hypma_005438 [Hypsizygus marmoreus]|uniref:F-box domain-containing protein n=1 Tax=Hypsizygus marmoreus TaxID=39966 RepID=A0A369J0X8_HYPMA|nr:hypothetical protein Hypma_005438 [Hypsizygus marmoreus]
MSTNVVTILEVAERAYSNMQQEADNSVLDAMRKEMRQILAIVETDAARLNAQIVPRETQRVAAVPQIVRMERILSPLSLNAIPNEILTRIFKLSLDGPIYLKSDVPCTAPITSLAQVCRKWNIVVMGTPVLWNNLSIDFGDRGDSSRLTLAVLECLFRAGPSSPLSICTRDSIVAGAAAHPNPIITLVTPHVSRLQHLALSLPAAWLHDFLVLPSGLIPTLESSDIEFKAGGDNGMVVLSDDMTVFAGAPGLHTLTFRMQGKNRHLHHGQPPAPPVLSPGAQLQLPWTQLTHLSFIDIPVPYSLFHRMIRQCTSLVSFATTRFGVLDTMFLCESRSYTLRSLEIEFTRDIPHNMQYTYPLVLPALSHLTLHGRHISWSQPRLSSLLKRFSCSGLIGFTLFHFQLDNANMESLLESLPDLEIVEFDLSSISRVLVEKMIRGELVPRLKRLQCMMDEAALEAFFLLLEARWACRVVDNSSDGVAYGGIESANIYISSSCRSSKKVEKTREYIRRLGDMGRGIEVRG